MPHRLVPIGAAVLVTLATSCSRDTLPTPPTDSGLRSSGVAGAGPAIPQPLLGVPVQFRLPIDLGNQWDYSRSYVVYSVSSAGDRTPLEQFYSNITDFMVCADTVNGNGYTYRSSGEYERIPGPTTYTWVGERQDVRGLYELDVNITQPPACVSGTPEASRAGAAGAVADRAARLAEAAIARLPAGPADARDRMSRQIRTLTQRAASLEEAMGPGPGIRPGELQRLAYPLTVGREWYVRNQPPDLVLTSQVLAREICQLQIGSFPAAKVGLVWVGTFGPRDSAASWYGKPGLLRFRYHFESEPDSVTRAVIVVENDQVLYHFHLVGNPGLAERQR